MGVSGIGQEAPKPMSEVLAIDETIADLERIKCLILAQTKSRHWFNEDLDALVPILSEMMPNYPLGERELCFIHLQERVGLLAATILNNDPTDKFKSALLDVAAIAILVHHHYKEAESA